MTVVVHDMDAFLRAWPQAFEADRAARADFGALVLGALLVIGVFAAVATLRWISRGGLRRSPVAHLTIENSSASEQ